MNKEQALGIIKQFLDEAIKLGVCKSIENASVLAQAFHVLTQSVKENTNG
jgi:hypothetical protein